MAEIDLGTSFPPGGWMILIKNVAPQTFRGEDIRVTPYGVFILVSHEDGKQVTFKRWCYWPWTAVERIYQRND